jgi:hypothetical protein
MSGLAALGAAWWLTGCSEPAGRGAVAVESEYNSDTAVPTSEASVHATATTAPAWSATAVPAQPTDMATPAQLQAAQGVSCPFGLLNDPYPGRCKHYVDSNGNGFCDRSELGSGDRTPREATS